MSRLLLVGIVGVIACSGAPPSPSSGAGRGIEPSAAPASLLDSLHKRSGGERIFVLFEQDGIGAHTRTRRLELLFEAEVISADLLEELDLIWVRTDGAVGVIDLRAPRARFVPIVENLPDVTVVVKGKASLTLGNEPGPSPEGDAMSPESLELTWTAEPTMGLVARGQSKPSPDIVAATKTTASFTGKTWLRREFRRSRSKLADVRPAAVPLVQAPRKDCQGNEWCKSGVPFGDRGWLLYVVTTECEGSTCRPHACALYDPKSQRVASPDGDPAWLPAADLEVASAGCGPFYFDEKRRSFATLVGLCAIGESKCVGFSALVLGTLQRGIRVELGP